MRIKLIHVKPTDQVDSQQATTYADHLTQMRIIYTLRYLYAITDADQVYAYEDQLEETHKMEKQTTGEWLTSTMLRAKEEEHKCTTRRELKKQTNTPRRRTRNQLGQEASRNRKERRRRRSCALGEEERKKECEKRGERS